jgi:rhamnosyltransferase
MICGVTVLYNPTEDIFENINSYLYGLDKLYLVDNSEKEDEKLKDKFINLSSKIEYIKMNGNEGIAKALNVAKNKAIEEKFDWILTMDQDSKFENNNFNRMLDLVKKYFNKEIAIFSPLHKFFNEQKINTKNEEIEERERIITSGNLLNLKIAQEIGNFEEKFFIDEVDHDYCYRIREKKYKIIVFNNIILNHKLGNIKKSKFFSSTTNHNYIRRYYITRNKLYMVKKYPFLKKRYIKEILRDTKKIILLEKDKIKKLKMIYLGIKDFKNNITGKINQSYLERGK